MRVSALTPADVPAYRALMLEAYEQSPDAFTTTAAERRDEPESWWIKRIGSADGLTTSFGAWTGGGLVGTVALEYSAKTKTRHSALLLGMYVQPHERGNAIGLALLNAAIAAASARPEILSITLTLTEDNASALRLYRSVGFIEWGDSTRGNSHSLRAQGQGAHVARIVPPSAIACMSAVYMYPTERRARKVRRCPSLSRTPGGALSGEWKALHKLPATRANA